MREKLVIIGNGMAPGRMLDHLMDMAPKRFDVTVFNAEPRVNYDRIMLSPVLSGERVFDDIIIHSDEWYASHNITLCKGEKVSEIDRSLKQVTSAIGRSVSYDKLIIATGSNPFMLPLPGSDLEGVLTYRDLDDVDAMLTAAEKGGKAVVIGGGLLGLEAAAGLNSRGMDVSVVHLPDHLMERQLDQFAGGLLKTELETAGLTIYTDAVSQEILGSQRVEGLKLEDGRIIEADLLVMAVGICPNISLAQSAKLATGRGIQVNEFMQTSDPDILALGECVEVGGKTYGLVAPLYDMAKIAAQKLSGEKAPGFSDPFMATKLKVTGVDLYSAGDFAESEDRENIILKDKSNGVYKRLVIEENKIIGIVLYGDTSDGAYFFNLLNERFDISAMRETLIFGEAYKIEECAA